MASSMLVPIYFVDAFTTNDNAAFTGNPAAVCILDYDDDIPDDIKQKIASEINLSETAFVSHGWRHGEKLLTAEGSNLHRRTIRWFTPMNEANLCGHATVATTKALAETQFTTLYLDNNVKTITISYESKFSGKLGAALSKDTGRITLNFPSNPCHELNRTEHAAWLDEMIRATLGNDVPMESVTDIQFSHREKILVLRLKDVEEHPEKNLEMVSPDYRKLRALPSGDLGVRDIIVTIKGADVKDGSGAPNFYSRFFAPFDGIEEDPVTGLGHTVLTPYWFQEFTKALKGEDFIIEKLLGRQQSIRGGHVHCTLLGDRVNLSGEARVTIKGQLFV